MKTNYRVYICSQKKGDKVKRLPNYTRYQETGRRRALSYFFHHCTQTINGNFTHFAAVLNGFYNANFKCVQSFFPTFRI